MLHYFNEMLLMEMRHLRYVTYLYNLQLQDYKPRLTDTQVFLIKKHKTIETVLTDNHAGAWL